MDTFTTVSVLVTIALCIGAVVGYNFALKDFHRWWDEQERTRGEQN